MLRQSADTSGRLFLSCLFFAGPSATPTAVRHMDGSVGSDRPATFEAAFSADVPAADSQTATPSPDQTPAASASADATVPPAADGQGPEGTTPTPGPIPYERHKAVLEGAYKERDQFKTDLETFKQQYEWATRVPREQLEAFAARAQQFERDPYAFLSDFMSELQGHPQYSTQFRSWVARQFAGLRTPQAQAQDPEPEPDIPVYDAEGREVQRTYSAAKLKELRQWERRQWDAEQERKVGEQRQAQQQAARAAQQAKQMATDIYSHLSSQPLYKEHEAEIAKVYAANPSWSAERAYLHVVLPKLQQAEQAKVLDNLEKKAAAQTVNPSQTTAARPVRPKSFHDPSLSWS